MTNYIDFSLYLLDEQFETIASKIWAFLPVWPLYIAKNLPFNLFFNNYETVRRK